MQLDLPAYGRYRYHNTAFVSWSQQHGLSKLKWLYDHVYLIRPSAWYDKVMIDCYRNELINRFCELAQVTTEHRCGNSSFFWNEDIEISISRGDQKLKIQFRKDNHTLIRILKEENNVMTWETLNDFPPAAGSLPQALERAETLVQTLSAIGTSAAPEEQ